MGIAVALQELAKSFSCYTVLVRTVYNDFVISAERLERLPHGVKVNGTWYMLRLVSPFCQSHYQAKIFLTVQLLLQFLATDRIHTSYLQLAVRIKHCESAIVKCHGWHSAC